MLDFLYEVLYGPRCKHTAALVMIRNIGRSFAIVPIWLYNCQWNKGNCRGVNSKFKELKSDPRVHEIFSQFTFIVDVL